MKLEPTMFGVRLIIRQSDSLTDLSTFNNYSMKIKYLFFIRNIHLFKFCSLWKQDLLSNWCCKIFMWFTEAYNINMFVKLIFKAFTLENSKKKGPNILPRHCLFFQSAHLAKTVFSVPNKLPTISALLKKNNLTSKKTKRLNFIQK